MICEINAAKNFMLQKYKIIYINKDLDIIKKKYDIRYIFKYTILLIYLKKKC